jgi:hypothetical protein
VLHENDFLLDEPWEELIDSAATVSREAAGKHGRHEARRQVSRHLMGSVVRSFPARVNLPVRFYFRFTHSPRCANASGSAWAPRRQTTSARTVPAQDQGRFQGRRQGSEGPGAGQVRLQLPQRHRSELVADSRFSIPASKRDQRLHPGCKGPW